MQHLIERNKEKDAIWTLSIVCSIHNGSLKLMQECAWWTVCAKCVQPMWHLTCTQQQLAEIHVIMMIQFWSNLLGLLTGFHRVPSIHASTNVIPTGFVSRCRWSLSIWSISDACACRVQASVRLLKMLRHIISKVKIFSDWCSVGTVLLLKCCSSLALWVFDFFLDFLECCSSLTFWDCYKLFVFDFRANLFRWLGLTSSDATTPLSLKVRRRRRESGPLAWHRQGLFND